VIDVKTGTTVKRLSSGRYEISLKGDRSDVKLDRQGFTLTRWGQQLVRVRQETATERLDREFALVVRAGRDELSADEKDQLLAQNDPLLGQLADPPTKKVIDLFARLPDAARQQLLRDEYLKWKYASLNADRQKVYRDALAVNIEIAKKQGVQVPAGMSLGALQKADVGFAIVNIPESAARVVSFYILLPEHPQPIWVTVVGARAAGTRAYINEHLGKLSSLRERPYSRDLNQANGGEAVGPLASFTIGANVLRVAYAHDGCDVLAFGDGGVRRINFGKGEAVWGAPIPRWGWSLAVSPTELRVLTGGTDGIIRMWDQRTGKLIREFAKHGGDVWGLAFLPGGKTFISGGDDKTIRLWDVESGQELRRFAGVDEGVRCLTLSRDGRTLVTAGKTVHVWDVATGKEIKTLKGHPEVVTSVAFSPDEKTILTTSHDWTMQLWNIETGELLRKFEGHASGVEGAAFTPDGRLIVSCSLDRTVRVWDVTTGKELHRFLDHKAGVVGVAVAPDGRQAVTGSSDGTVRLWRLPPPAALANDKKVGEIRRIDVLHPINGHVAVFADGRRVLTPSDDALRIWDLETGKLLRRFEGGRGSARPCALSPEGRQVLTGTLEGEVVLWDVETGREVKRIKGHKGLVAALEFSPDGKQALSGAFDGTVRLWELASGKELRHIDIDPAIQVFCVRFSPDGRHAMAGTLAATRHMWELKTGKELRRFSGHSNWILSVAISPEGRHALSCSVDGSVRLWEMATGKELRRFVQSKVGVPCVAFSLDGRRALSGGGDILRLWDVETGEQLIALEGHAGSLDGVAFTPDGRRAVSANRAGILRYWQLPEPSKGPEPGLNDALNRVEADLKALLARETEGKTDVNLLRAEVARFLWRHAGTTQAIRAGEILTRLPSPLDKLDPAKVPAAYRSDKLKELVAVLQGHEHAVNHVAFHRDGALLASNAPEEKASRLWSLVDGAAPIKSVKLEGHTENTWTVAFSPDGKLLASSSSDKTVRLWKLKGDKPKEWAIVQGYTWSISWLAFSPDSKTLASSSWDPQKRGIVRLLDVSGDTPTEQAVLVGHAFQAQGVAFSPDGRTLACGSLDGTVRLWDLKRARPAVQHVLTHPNPVNLVASAPDGRSLISSCDDGQLRLWDLSKDKPEQRAALPGQCAAFSPDGRTVASVGSDGKVFLSDASFENDVVKWQLPGASFVTFAPDGRHLAVGSTKGVIYILRLGYLGKPAQQDKIDAAVKAAHAWLKLVNEGHYAQSWEQSSTTNKKGVAKQDMVAFTARCSASLASWSRVVSSTGTFIHRCPECRTEPMWSCNSRRLTRT